MASFDDLLDRVLPDGWRAVAEIARAETEVAFRTREARDGWNAWTPTADAAIPPWVDAAMELASTRVIVLGGQLAAHIRPPSDLPEYMELAIHFAAADAYWKVRQFEVGSGRVARDPFAEAEREFRWELKGRLLVELNELYLDAWVKYAGELKAQAPEVAVSRTFELGDDSEPSIRSAPDQGDHAAPPALPRGAGRQWSDVEIAFLSEQVVEVRIKDEPPYLADYAEMGFADTRKHNAPPCPMKSWALLGLLAPGGGTAPDPALRSDNRRPNRRERDVFLKGIREIRDRIGTYFSGIEGRAVRFSKGTGHKTVFKLSRHPDYQAGHGDEDLDALTVAIEDSIRTSNITEHQLYDDRRKEFDRALSE
jgi:hypothetical protein